MYPINTHEFQVIIRPFVHQWYWNEQDQLPSFARNQTGEGSHLWNQGGQWMKSDINYVSSLPSLKILQKKYLNKV